MKETEFKTQVLKTAEQWGSGLFHRLRQLDDGGCTILSIPAVSKKFDPPPGISSPVVLAADCCGLLFILDRTTRLIYKHDPSTGISERAFCPSYLDGPRRIALSGKRLWVADTAGGEIICCSIGSLQVITGIRLLEEPVDIAVNSRGELYALDKKTKIIYRFDRHGSLICKFGEPHITGPVSLTTGKEDIIYVIDEAAGERCNVRLLRFSREGEYLGAGGSVDMESPVIIIGAAEGGGYVLTDSGIVSRFDQDGISAGKVLFPEDAGPVIWLAADGCGRLYASTGTAIYVLVAEKVFTKEKGFYYSKTLDGGLAENRWHRLVMSAEIPLDTVADVYSYASDDADLKDLVDGVLADPAKTTEEKAAVIDSAITWRVSGTASEKNAQDMLLRVNGRFLWVKLVLSTYDEKAKPTVRGLKIYTPGISYLRYLPAIYQEDAVSKDFLERFLSIFESVFYDLEVDISEVSKYFDPDITPPEFLKWLGSWVNMAVEEEWSEETKREFIRQAVSLYKMKGTVAGVSRFIQMYTGRTPVIIEHARTGSPAVIGGEFRLGINMMIVKTPVRGFRLGDDSIIGRTALRNVVYALEDPFLASAYSFTVLVSLTQEERGRYEKGLRKIISEVKPAHTACALRIAGGLSAGSESYVGISSYVHGFGQLRLGTTAVGDGLLPAEDEEGRRIGDGATIGKDIRLM